jgi:hypothetical protein
LAIENRGNASSGRFPRSLRPRGNSRIPIFWVATPRVCPYAMQKPVRILNPVSNCHFTTRNRAHRFVKKGRAQWVEVDRLIRFVDSHSDHRSTKEFVDRTRGDYDRAASNGRASMRELANLPMTKPARFLNMGNRKGASRHTFLALRGLPIGR